MKKRAHSDQGGKNERNIPRSCRRVHREKNAEVCHQLGKDLGANPTPEGNETEVSHGPNEKGMFGG